MPKIGEKTETAPAEPASPKEKGDKKIFFPDLAFSTDNGAMIAYMGWIKSSNAIKESLEINPTPSSSLA